MAKLHSASPHEITALFPPEIISELHSKACNNLYILISGFKGVTHEGLLRYLDILFIFFYR